MHLSSGRGALVLLGRDHPLGDFIFVRYTWSAMESAAFLQSGKPPIPLHQLPGDTPAVPIYLYCRSKICTLEGLSLTSAQFRRLNASSLGRLVVWNLFRLDEEHRLCPLVVIPTEDITPTQTQRELYSRNLRRPQDEEPPKPEPPLSAVLNSGLLATDYVVGGRGALGYNEDWSEMRTLRLSFTRPLTTPVSIARSAARQVQRQNYCHRLALTLQAQADEDAVSNSTTAYNP